MMGRFRERERERARERDRQREGEAEQIRACRTEGARERGGTPSVLHRRSASASAFASVTRWFRNFLQSVSSVCRLFSFEFEAVL